MQVLLRRSYCVVDWGGLRPNQPHILFNELRAEGVQLVTVNVRLWGILGRYHPGGTPSEAMEVKLPEAATVADLLGALDLPERYLQRAAVFRGDEQVHPDQSLEDGDELNALLPSAGGAPGLRTCLN